MKRFLTTLAAALAVCSAALADDTPVNPDRPDLPQSSFTVGKGHFQVEAGVQYDHATGDDVTVNTFTVPTTLRYGVSNDLEVRLDTSGYIRQRDEFDDFTFSEHGASDIRLGIKKHLSGDADTRSTGFLLGLEVPSGSRDFRIAGVVPSATFAEDVNLHGTALSVNVGLVYQPGAAASKREAAGLVAASLTHPITPKLSGFVDAGGVRGINHAGGPGQVGLGLELGLGDHAWDAAAHFGVTADAPDTEFTAGYSQRW